MSRIQNIAYGILLSAIACSYASAQDLPDFLVPISEVKNGQSVADVESKLGPPLATCKPKREDDKQAFTQAWTDFYLKSERRVYLRGKKAAGIDKHGNPYYSFLLVIYFDGKVNSVTLDPSLRPYRPHCSYGDWS